MNCLVIHSAGALAVLISLSALADDAAAPPTAAPAAQNGRPDPQQIFLRLDANGDGHISPDEIPPARRAMIEPMLTTGDKDGDKRLSRDEFIQAFANAAPADPTQARPAAAGPLTWQQFERLDANADGKVTREEIPAEARVRTQSLFVRADRDADGTITRAEFEGALAAEATNTTPRRGGLADAAGEANLNRVGPPSALFQVLDTNHDGQFSTSEIQSAAAVLQKLDTNSDGIVTPAEILASQTPPAKSP